MDTVVWMQEPGDYRDCYGVDMKCSPQAHVLEHLVSSQGRCFRRFLKLRETGRAWLADVGHMGRSFVVELIIQSLSLLA